MKLRAGNFATLLTLWVLAAGMAHAQAFRTNAGFTASSLQPGDDGPSSPAVPLGFTVNFFGRTFTSAFVNHNGNITFGQDFGEFTPQSLNALPVQIVAPFWADVDTRGTGSITYGTDTVNGRPAFGVNWSNVGYFGSHTDKLNSFQLVLIDRSDTGPGNFDMEFNYRQIQWEVGDASGGNLGLCGAGNSECFPASAGYSNGSGARGTFLSLPGSLQAGAFLDSSPTALIRRAQNSDTPGRLVFFARNGSFQSLTASPSPLVFNSVNRAQPPSQTVDVNAVSTASVATTSGGNWLSVAFVPPGTSGNKLQVSMNPSSVASLAFGSYQGSVTFTAVGSETGDQTVTVPVTLNLISPVLTASPTSLTFTSQNRALPPPQGVDFSQPITATVVDGASWLSLAYSPPGTNGTRLVVSINPSVLNTLPFGAQQTRIRAVAVSDSSRSLEIPVTLRLIEPESVPTIPPPVISASASCPATTLTVGQAYTGNLSATGGGAFIEWNLRGNFPPGLRVVGNTVVGAPNTAGTYSYTIEASSPPYTATVTCNVTVVPGPLRITTGCPTTAAPQGSRFNFPVIPSGGAGGSSYVYTATGLPEGLTIANGQISGTPTAAVGNYQIQITVSSGGQTATLSCPVEVAPPSGGAGGPGGPGTAEPLRLSGQCPASVFRGAPVKFEVSATGGNPGYRFSLSGPSWLTLTSSGATASISGNADAPAGVYAFTVTATDAGGGTQTFSCSVVVNEPPLALNGTCPTSASVFGAPISIPLSATGGRGTYTWAIVSAPSWLTLNGTTGSAVTLAGNAGDVGDFPFTVSVTDSDSVTRTFNCTLRVNAAPLSITAAPVCPAAPVSRQAVFSTALTAAGGVPPYNWQISGPSWLTLSSQTGTTVTASGTPAASGQQSFTVTLSDGRSSTPATYTCPLNVAPIVPPSVQITGITAQVSVNQAGPLVIQLSGPAPVDLVATITLTFRADVALTELNNGNNPWVQFGPLTQGPITIERNRITVLIPRGQQTVPLAANIALSNVAGTIDAQVTSLRDGTSELLTAPISATPLRIARQAPVITDNGVQFTRNGLTIQGSSSTLDMQSITLTFNPKEGAEIEGDRTFTFNESSHQIQSKFRTLFLQRFSDNSGSGTGTNAGSNFTIQFPISLSGDDNVIDSVTITMTNSAGSSSPRTEPLR